MFKKMKFLAAAIGLSALAALAAGCGGDSGKGGLSAALDAAGIVEAVHAAPERAEDAGSAKMEIEVEVTVAGQKSRVTSEGEVDFKRQALHQKMEADGFDLEQIVVDGTIYIRGLGSDEWTSTSLAEMQSSIGINPDNVRTNNDALSQMNALADLEDIELIGQEKIRGQAANHFRGYVDVVEQLRKLSKGDAQAEQLVALMSAVLAGPKVPTDVWIDAQGRAIRTKSTFVYDWAGAAATMPELAAQGAALGTMTMSLDIEFYDWGIPVTIEAPTG
jgi:hypothetical protein